LKSRDFYKNYCVDPKYFSRKSTLNFENVSLLILRLLKSSTSTELKNFHETIHCSDEIENWVSNSAFCKARQKIKSEFFKELCQYSTSHFYRSIGGGRWANFRLLGVDGSEFNLPSSKELLDEFKCHHTNSIGTKIPQARVSFICDVLNKVVIDAQMESFKVGEQAMLGRQLKHLGKGDLLTADSNYGHFHILKEVLLSGADYCFRMSQSAGFIKEFIASNQDDMILEWSPSKGTISTCKKHDISTSPLKLRLVRVQLSEQETEILATSLLDQQKYTYLDIKHLYNTRWETEEAYKIFMQRLQVEFFSSLKTNGVQQDFYANIFMQNLVSFLAGPIKKTVLENSKDLKYERQINWTSALSDVRRKFVLLFVRSTRKVDKIIDSLQASFMANTEAIKPDRKFPRDKRKKGARKKAFICYKPIW